MQTLLLFLPSTLLNPRVGVINNSRKMATSIKLCPLANTQVIPVLHKNFQRWTANPTKCQNWKIEGGRGGDICTRMGTRPGPYSDWSHSCLPCSLCLHRRCRAPWLLHTWREGWSSQREETRHGDTALMSCNRGERKNSRKMGVGTSRHEVRVTCVHFSVTY